MRASEHALHDDDVEPLAELATDLAFGADDVEAQRRVQRNRRLVAADDAGQNGMESMAGGGADQTAEE